MDTEKPEENSQSTRRDAPRGRSVRSILEGQLSPSPRSASSSPPKRRSCRTGCCARARSFENARRRAERERSEYLQFAAMDLVRDLLPILDDFERAMQGGNRRPRLRQRRRADLSADGRHAQEDRAGADRNRRANSSTPTCIRPIERVQTEDAEDQAILGEFQRGYHFKGKLLRPAMVKVAVRP